MLDKVYKGREISSIYVANLVNCSDSRVPRGGKASESGSQVSGKES